MRRTSLLALLLPALAGGCATFQEPDPFDQAFGAADTLRTERVAPGVRHAYAWEARGPWAIHVAAVELDACLRPEARHAGPPLTRTAPTSAIAGGAVAAVNADFFALPEGTPVGAQVSDGRVLIAPGRWQAVGFRGEERAIGAADLRGGVRMPAGSVTVEAVNRPPPDTAPDAGVRLYTEWAGGPISVGSGRLAAALSPLPSRTMPGAGAVTALALGPGSIDVPAGGAVIDGPRTVLSGLSLEDTITWAAEVRIGELLPEELLGGFPVLLRGGEVPPELATEPRESFGRARHPRTAVGWRRGGPLLLVTVDGRQAPYSDGMTLAELAELMGRLGATEALNLDGGGSTTMVLDGRVVNRPSDESGERPVGNALVVVRRCD